MTTFKELGLKQEILEAVELLGFETPTKVQELAIPNILASQRDLIALAQTGTGKTGAFGLPAVQQVNPDSGDVQVLVLSPTRELAIQIAKDMKSYAKKIKGISTVAVYGGANISSQIRALKNGAQIVIGTPGRMLDLIRRRKLDVTNVRTLVLDEADEMLNMGFQDDLDAILKDTPEGKQTLLFSATMPKQIAKMAKKYMHNPDEIEVGERNSGALNVDHHYYMVKSSDRFLALKRIVDMNPDVYGIIFCRTRRETQDVSTKLNKDGYDVDLLNGDLSQSQRDNVMNRFRTKELQLLVATDVAARGLDVESLTHVINYNLPDDLEVYIHRSGRTGRAGNSGIAVSIVQSRENGRIKALEKMSGKNFTKQELPSGDEVLGIKMLDMINSIKEMEVNEDQIKSVMPQILDQLQDLDREELIMRFISKEFDKAMNFYENSRDLNANSRSNSNGKSNNSRNGHSYANNYDRYFINIGRRDNLNPVRLMGLVNEQLNGSKPDFGNIDIQNNFSFFEVEPGYEIPLTSQVSGAHFEGRSVNVEVAEQDKKSKGKPRNKRKRSKQYA